MTENPKPRLRTASRFRSSKVGFPIRKSADQSSFAAPHGLSQRTTSFIASQRQGIHQMLLRHLIALTIDVHSPRQRSFDHSVALMIAGSRRIRERPMLASQPIQTDVSVATALAPSIPSVRPEIAWPAFGWLLLHDVKQRNFPLADFAAAWNWFLTDEAPEFGGARRNRTDDLLLAKQALSQLSYGPGPRAPSSEIAG